MQGYWSNAFRGLRREKVFSGLVVLIVSVGVAASTSMMVLLHALNADPLPGASDRVFHPQLEPSVAGRPPSEKGNLPDALMWMDAINLLHAPAGKRKAVILEGQITVRPASWTLRSHFAKAVYTQASFFQMFRVPFASGANWSAEDDERGARVVVLSRRMAQQTFGADDAIGRTFVMDDHPFRVVGVTGNWEPRPRFYNLSSGPYVEQEDVYLPLRTALDLSMQPSTSPACWGNELPDLSNLDKAACTWVDFWVELESAEERASYLQFLTGYSAQQNAAGRFYRLPQVALPNVKEWLTKNNVVPGIAKLQAFIAYSFLAICVFNAGALLLVVFLRRRKELGLRRALGATRKRLMMDLLLENSGLAIASAVGGSFLAWASIALLRTRPEAYYVTMHADPWMVFVGVTTAVTSIVVAILLPAWQVVRANPYSMLRS